MIKYYIEYQYFWYELYNDHMIKECSPIHRQIFDDEQEMSSVIYRLKKRSWRK